MVCENVPHYKAIRFVSFIFCRFASIVFGPLCIYVDLFMYVYVLLLGI